METGLATTKQDELDLDEERIALIKRTIARGASDDELDLFIEQCRRTKLDPFARQIYSVRRKQWNSQTRSYEEAQVIQVSIDGFRLIADRTHKYAGQVGPWWCGPDGAWREVWLEEVPPAAAKMGVLRHDFQAPIFAIALFKSYVQTNSNGDPISRWKTDPAGMIAKCAEALALRRAFPNDLSGLYTTEEMGQADNPTISVENHASPSLPNGKATPALPQPAADPVVEGHYTPADPLPITQASRLPELEQQEGKATTTPPAQPEPQPGARTPLPPHLVKDRLLDTAKKWADKKAKESPALRQLMKTILEDQLDGLAIHNQEPVQAARNTLLFWLTGFTDMDHVNIEYVYALRSWLSPTRAEDGSQTGYTLNPAAEQECKACYIEATGLPQDLIERA